MNVFDSIYITIYIFHSCMLIGQQNYAHERSM